MNEFNVVLDLAWAVSRQRATDEPRLPASSVGHVTSGQLSPEWLSQTASCEPV